MSRRSTVDRERLLGAEVVSVYVACPRDDPYVVKGAPNVKSDVARDPRN